MSKEIPKYPFTASPHLDFEITTIEALYKKNKAKLIRPHRQNFYGIFFFTKTAGSHFIDFVEYPIKKNSLFLISDEQVHYFKNINKTKGIVLLFTGSFLKAAPLLEQNFDNHSPLIQITNPTLKEIETIFQQIADTYQSQKKYKHLILRNYLEIILANLSSFSQSVLLKPDKNLDRFIQFKQDLKVNFREYKTVTYYAQKQFTTPKTLNLIVRSATDQSAKQYLISFIILQAKRLLINTNLSLSDVAEELGFDEATNFTKFFKKHTEVAPSQFQKSLLL